MNNLCAKKQEGSLIKHIRTIRVINNISESPNGFSFLFQALFPDLTLQCSACTVITRTYIYFPFWQAYLFCFAIINSGSTLIIIDFNLLKFKI